MRQQDRKLNSDPPWNLDRIDQRSDNLDGEYNFNSTGKGVNVYVIDTGIRETHGKLMKECFIFFSKQKYASLISLGIAHRGVRRWAC